MELQRTIQSQRLGTFPSMPISRREFTIHSKECLEQRINNMRPHPPLEAASARCMHHNNAGWGLAAVSASDMFAIYIDGSSGLYTYQSET